MERARTVRDAWTEAEPQVLVFLRRLMVRASLYVASPFLALSILLVLLDEHPLLVALPALVGLAVIALGWSAYLLLRHRIRRLGRRVLAAAGWEPAPGEGGT